MGTTYAYISDLNEKRTSEYVYFIADRNGNCKVGRAYNPQLRLLGLQTGNASELSIFALLKVKAGDAGMVEKDLHEILKDANVRGEWYRLRACTRILKNGFDAGGYRFTPFSERQLQQWTDELCGGETA